MSLNVNFVTRHALFFRTDLGRQSGTLASADDTTFIADMKRQGAREQFLGDKRVVHMFGLERLRASYLLRRAMWQGRSEYRRNRIPRDKNFRCAGNANVSGGRNQVLGGASAQAKSRTRRASNS